jgi:hypothetical protein
MAKLIFDIGDLYGRVWGGLLFPELLRRNKENLKDYFKLNKNDENAIPANPLGKPVQSELVLRLDGEEMRFAVPPVLTITGSINVVETAVAGLDGTIKEIASVSDYSVNIKGFLVDSNYTDVEANGFRFRVNPSEFPEKELRRLRRFFEAKKMIEVVESRLLNFFNIKNLLFKSLNFPELEGYTATIPFEAEAVSDQEYTLILE